MMDKKLTALTGMSAPSYDDLFYVVNNPGGSPASQYIAFADLKAALLGSLPDGTVINGKIVITVASNNITLALKTLAGADPSATDLVLVMLNGALCPIASARSVTVNAGANSFNAGSAELATKEIDYFAYLRWEVAASAVRIGFARIPYGLAYSDFSTTATNEKYAAWSGTASAAAGDPCYVVGRFAATLSAGAGYTWTVPTYTALNLVQGPIYETRALTWAPVGTNWAQGNGTVTAVYTLVGRRLYYEFLFVLGSSGSSISGDFAFTLSWTPADTIFAFAQLTDTGTASYVGAQSNSGATISVRVTNAAGTYLTNSTNLSATVPHTWANTDRVLANNICRI